MNAKGIFILAVILMASISSAVSQGPIYYEELTPKNKIRFSKQTHEVKLTGQLESIDYSDGVFILRESRSFDQYGQKQVVWHIVDTTGVFLAKNLDWNSNPFKLPVFDNGYAINHNNGTSIIDKTGKTVCDLSKTYDFTGEKFVDGLVLVAGKRFREGNEEYHRVSYVGTDGKIKYPNLTAKVPKWDVYTGVPEVAPLKDGLRRHYDFKTKKYGFIAEDGTFAVKPQYAAAHDFSDGMAAVLMTTADGDKWGFIDKTGKVVIEPMFTQEPRDFHDSIAVVTKNTGWKTLLLKDGKIFDLNCQILLDYNGGCTFLTTSEGKQFIVNTELRGVEVYASRRQISLYGMDVIKAVRDINIPLNYNNNGIYNEQFVPLVVPDYGIFAYLGGGLFWYESNHVDYESGVIRANGERLMVFRKSEW